MVRDILITKLDENSQNIKNNTYFSKICMKKNIVYMQDG